MKEKIPNVPKRNRIIAVTGSALKAAILSAAVLTGAASCYLSGGSEASGGPPAMLSIRTLVPVSGGTITVTGPGMSPVTTAVSAGEQAKTLEVPSGKDRTVTLTLSGATVTLTGTSTTDLAPGETKTLVLRPTVSSSKILVFDMENLRLVQIDSMNGENWKAVNAMDFDPGADLPALFPFMYDFDSSGRVYLINMTEGYLPSGVFRFPDIDHPELYEGVLSSFTYPLINFVIDRRTDILYFMRQDEPGLWRLDLNAAGPPELIQATVDEWNDSLYPNFFPGPLTIDSRGRLYAADVGGYHNIIMRMDLSLPAGSRIKIFDPAAYSGPLNFISAGTPNDIVAVGSSVYVLYPDSGGAAVFQFDGDLNPLASFGTVVTAPSGPGQFRQPMFFLRVAGNSIHVVDDDPIPPGYGGQYDRIVAFDSITGTNWRTFGSTGTGENQFVFTTSY